MFRTGNSKVKQKLKSVSYFDSTEGQVNFLTNSVVAYIKEIGVPKRVYLEGLSFMSKGDQTRNLAMVYGVFVDKLHEQFGLDWKDIVPVAPTSIKAVTRKFYKPEDQYSINTKGKKILRPIGKEEVIEIAETLHPDVLYGLVKSSHSERSGKEDLSDALMVMYAGLIKEGHEVRFD